MGLITVVVIAFASLLLGIALQAQQRRDGFGWLAMAVAIAFGAYFFSETLPTSAVFESIEEWGPQVDGFYVIPGVIGAAVMGAFAYVGTLTSPQAARAN